VPRTMIHRSGCILFLCYVERTIRHVCTLSKRGIFLLNTRISRNHAPTKRPIYPPVLFLPTPVASSERWWTKQVDPDIDSVENVGDSKIIASIKHQASTELCRCTCGRRFTTRACSGMRSGVGYIYNLTAIGNILG
jgi:hypothetical protein